MRKMLVGIRRYNLLLIGIVVSSFTNPSFANVPYPAKHISVLQFGAIPNDGKNDIIAFRKVADYCRQHPNSVLTIPAGVYDVVDSLALEIEKNAITGVYGGNPQGVLFKPDAPYVKVLDFSGSKNLKVIATGATLALSGWYEPVTIDNSENFELNGLNITYKRPPNTSGSIIKQGYGFFDVQIDTSVYTLLKSKIIGSIHFYHPQTDQLYGINISDSKLISADIIRVYSPVEAVLGDQFIVRHSGHYRPAIMIKNSKNVVLNDVKIHSQPGMGVVGHLSENITLNQLQVIPLPGQFISTNTDATHFTSCKGKLAIKNSKFGGQGDDCTNIHNYYYVVDREKDEKYYNIKIENADLHAQSLDYPDKGDKMLLVSRRTLQPLQDYEVRAVDTSTVDWSVRIQLDKSVAFDLDSCFMTNITRVPSVYLLNNTVRGHLARAFLVKASNVLISGNTIQNSTGTAIQLGPEVSWRESGPVKNITIRNNWIINCGYGRGTQNQASAISIGVSGISTPYYLNQHLTISDNVIRAVNMNAIFVSDATDVNIERNSISGSENSVFAEHVKNANISNNGQLPVIKTE